MPGGGGSQLGCDVPPVLLNSSLLDRIPKNGWAMRRVQCRTSAGLGCVHLSSRRLEKLGNAQYHVFLAQRSRLVASALLCRILLVVMGLRRRASSQHPRAPSSGGGPITLRHRGAQGAYATPDASPLNPDWPVVSMERHHLYLMRVVSAPATGEREEKKARPPNLQGVADPHNVLAKLKPVGRMQPRELGTLPLDRVAHVPLVIRPYKSLLSTPSLNPIEFDSLHCFLYHRLALSCFRASALASPNRQTCRRMLRLRCLRRRRTAT